MEGDLNLKATELTLGLPGTDAISPAKSYKRSSPESDDAGGLSGVSSATDHESAPAPK